MRDPPGTPLEPAPSLADPPGPSYGRLSAFRGSPGGPRSSAGSAGGPRAEAEAPWSASSGEGPPPWPWSSELQLPRLSPPLLPLKNSPERICHWFHHGGIEAGSGWNVAEEGAPRRARGWGESALVLLELWT